MWWSVVHTAEVEEKEMTTHEKKKKNQRKTQYLKEKQSKEANAK